MSGRRQQFWMLWWDPARRFTLIWMAAKGDLIRAFGRVTITIANFVTIGGDFGFEKSTSNGVSKILVGAAGISTFLGTTDESSMGVRITNAFFGMVLIQNPAATTSMPSRRAARRRLLALKEF